MGLFGRRPKRTQEARDLTVVPFDPKPEGDGAADGPSWLMDVEVVKANHSHLNGIYHLTQFVDDEKTGAERRQKYFSLVDDIAASLSSSALQRTLSPERRLEVLLEAVRTELRKRDWSAFQAHVSRSRGMSTDLGKEATWEDELCPAAAAFFVQAWRDERSRDERAAGRAA
jgi:hypothetical protein